MVTTCGFFQHSASSRSSARTWNPVPRYVHAPSLANKTTMLMLLNDHIFLSHRSGRDCFLRCWACCSALDASWWCKQLEDARARHLFFHRIIISVFLLLYFRQSITPWPIILVVCVWSSIMKTSRLQTLRREKGQWRMKVGLNTDVNQSASAFRVITFFVWSREPTDSVQQVGVWGEGAQRLDCRSHPL